MIRRLQPLSTLALAAILILAGGCADRTPTEVELRPGLKVGDVAQVISAPVAFGEGTYGRIIGPEGGSISFGIGRLDFPAGALRQPTYISAEVDGETIGATFGPHGLTFPTAARPTLTFYLVGTSVDFSSASVLYVSNANVILEVLDSQLNPTGLSVQSRVDHFSKFIFGAN